MSKKLPRREFLQTLGGAAVVGAWPGFASAQAARRIAVFQEPEFPRIQSADVNIEVPVTFLSEQELIARLNVKDFDLFVNPYGSAFPKRAWKVILEYLRAGGNWLNCGGVPLSRPVVRTGSGWRAEPYQSAYHKRIGITHSFPAQVGKIVGFESELPGWFQTSNVKEIYELYIRLSSSSTESDEAGSDGPHEGVVERLVSGGNLQGRSIAAPVIQIDRLQAEFAAVSGVIDADEHWLPVERSGLFGATEIEPVSQTEAIAISGRDYLLRFEGEKIQRIEKSVIQNQKQEALSKNHGSGKLIWSPLPLELGDSMEALVAFYRMALAQARVAPIFNATPRTPSVLVLPSLFRDVVLYTFVSEIDRDTAMQVTHSETRTRFSVNVPAGRTAMVIVDRRNGKVITQPRAVTSRSPSVSNNR